MMREVPDEFWDFCTGLHQDAELYGPTVDDWIIGALGLVKRRRYRRLRDYLDHILRTETDDGLRDIYNSTWKEWSFEDLRGFLTRVRNIIETVPETRFGLTASERARR
jgi:hypothetical protein